VWIRWVLIGGLFAFIFLLGKSLCPCLFPDQPGKDIARCGGVAGAPALLTENKGSVAVDFKNNLRPDCAWGMAIIYPANPIWLAIAGLWPLACARLVRVSVVVASLVAGLVVVGRVDHGCFLSSGLSGQVALDKQSLHRRSSPPYLVVLKKVLLSQS
jgi:hypothetical protein